jgi:DNA-binding transcriptional MerR regulator
MANTPGKASNLYGIGAVARLTGLTDHTIRVWERRYEAVVAERAENGRRVYTPADVEKLGLLKRLTDQGLSIGRIAGDSLDQLHARLRDMNQLASAPAPQHISTAVLGEFLPDRFAGHEGDVAPVDIAVADQRRDAFLADLKRHEIDVVVLETPVLDGQVINELRGYMDHADARRGVIVYSYGRQRDVDLARDSSLVVVRAPANVDDVRAAVIRAFTPTPAARPAPPDEAPVPEWEFSEPIPARRFSSAQLATLARASTAIDCECPHHLAQLVGDLTAFEIYSATCENRDDQDAALHRYLHQTTARARALIEEALERVALAEGIDY